MPQLDIFSFQNQFFWLSIDFFLMYFFIVYIILPKGLYIEKFRKYLRNSFIQSITYMQNQDKSRNQAFNAWFRDLSWFSFNRVTLFNSLNKVTLLDLRNNYVLFGENFQKITSTFLNKLKVNVKNISKG